MSNETAIAHRPLGQRVRDEMAIRHVLPEGPAVDWYGDQIGRHMWVVSVGAHDLASWLVIDGLLKPDYEAPTSSALRRSFLDSLDAVLVILDAAGVMWGKHPELTMSGDVTCKPGEGLEFTGVQCRVSLYLEAARTI